MPVAMGRSREIFKGHPIDLQAAMMHLKAYPVKLQVAASEFTSANGR